jgi:hypothetical protein
MTGKELIYRRIVNQRMTCAGGTKGNSKDLPGTPEALVRWMGCIQSQDFGQAKWAIGVRDAALTEANIHTAFNAGRILRTHVLRPTWHFVVPEDIRWMLELTAPRIRQFSQPYNKKLELDAAVFRRSRKTLAKALEGGGQLTRVEIGEAFRRVKIETGDIRMNFLLMDAELEGLICSGPRRGKQFTYSLLEKRAPGARMLSPEEAVAELAARYFRSRGPATVADFAWWSGLTMREAGGGLEAVKGRLERVVVDGEVYWFAGSGGSGEMPRAVLLPAFDEYAVAYKDRSLVVAPEHAKESSGGLKPAVIVHGKVAGVWGRDVHKEGVKVRISMFGKVSKTLQAAITRETGRYVSFCGK